MNHALRRRRSITGAGVTIGLVALVGAGCGGVVSFETEAGPEPIVSGVYATTTVIADDSCSPPLEVESPARAAVFAAAANGPRWVRLPALDFLTMEAPWEGDAYVATFESDVLREDCPEGWMSATVDASSLRDGRFTADVDLVYTGLTGCEASSEPWPIPAGDCTVRLTTTYELVEACEAPRTIGQGSPTCDSP